MYSIHIEKMFMFCTWYIRVPGDQYEIVSVGPQVTIYDCLHTVASERSGFAIRQVGWGGVVEVHHIDGVQLRGCSRLRHGCVVAVNCADNRPLALLFNLKMVT